MTAPVTSYTTTDAVRSCAGITDNEMSDDFLRDMGLSSSVIIALESWLADHATHWVAFKGANPSASEMQIGRAIPLYCNWKGAAIALNAYLAIPKEISDGKSSLARFSADSAKRALENAVKMSNQYKSIIENAVASDVYSAASVMGRASPSYDPVTGVET